MTLPFFFRIMDILRAVKAPMRKEPIRMMQKLKMESINCLDRRPSVLKEVTVLYMTMETASLSMLSPNIYTLLRKGLPLSTGYDQHLFA